MALRDQPYFPLYVQDYLTDEKLNNCSAATQGIYIKIMCILHKQVNYGQLLFKQNSKQKLSTGLNAIQYFASILSKQLTFDLSEILPALTELIEEDVLQITEDGLSQKRMVKDFNTSQARSEAGKKGGGNPILFKQKVKHQFKQKDKQNPEYEIEYENENESNKRKRGAGEKPKLNFGSLQDSFSEKWETWIRFKKEQFKQSYKNPESEQLAINSLIEISKGDYISAEKIINQSISNLWKGLFELKENTNNGKSTTGSGAKEDKFGRIPKRDLVESLDREIPNVFKRNPAIRGDNL